MDALQQFKAAVASGDCEKAQALAASFSRQPATMQEVSAIRDTLRWALQLTRLRQAQASAELVELIRASAYRTRNTQVACSWSLDG